MKNKAKKDVVMSPCVGVCALDDDDVCIGCFRSGQEITRWGYVDNEGKRDILRKVEERMLKSDY
ncbi:DUF1289 domain-containing protein [Ketobacter sp. MCCC 1A13808]|uniref:DUF1289 domain-containing protein n=1 Tax=Ketobacter sp. MCCC 1A13808 TaxID=2602738 RepID=UPI000F11DE64|nr:DUF1289 domain-containing protein [Ketobacter sp. MCCC 1A13808]MVF14177.1 DUF1289 domain-containing protein [Ketobacter sp. MCCC 1A13808]RLP54084.1 MAG: DUF1289 domain-containing protein [Ketobacter sp.]